MTSLVRATIQVQGVDATLSQLRATELRMRGRLDLALDRTALSAQRHVKQLLSEPGSGRIYTRRGVQHRASAPGRPPAVDTGTYRASWHTRRTASLGGGNLGREVYTRQQRAEALEFGTRDGRISARPHAGPTAEWASAEWKKNARRALQEV